MSDARARLISCFASVLPKVPVAEIPAATIDTVPSWDSLTTIELITAMEQEFSIAIPTEDLADLVSFDTVYAYLALRLVEPG